MPRMQTSETTWLVVGGAGLGGLIVRDGPLTDTPQLPDRLETGSVVRQLALQGARLRYELIEGGGPATGWVSISLPATGKELLVRREQDSQQGRGATTGAQGSTSSKASSSVPEKRLFEDGSWYTRQECIDFFGGTVEWELAGEAAAEAEPGGPGTAGSSSSGPAASAGMGGRSATPGAPRPSPFAAFRNKQQPFSRGPTRVPYGAAAQKFGQSLATCSGCGLRIMGQHVIVDSKTFHLNCFTCAACRKAIQGTYYPNEAGRNMCEDCMVEALPKCDKCGEHIKGDSMIANNKNYHAECFKCDQCAAQITGSYFLEKGVTLCEACAVKQLPTCSVCHKPILGDGSKVGDEVFHTECFKCIACRRPITGTFYQEGKGYKCERCLSGNLPTCWKCRKKITGDAKVMGSKAFHPDCFVCGSCGWKITGHYIPKFDKPICDWCRPTPGRFQMGWQQQQPSVACARCALAIDGQAVTAEGKAYHPTCFKCEACFKQIKGLYYPDDGQRILCEPCFADQCPKCAWCKQPIMDDFTQADGKDYHVNCFACGSCGNSITSQFYNCKEEDEDHFICEKCYTGPVPNCLACRGPVRGAYVVANGATYHKKCFVCSTCRHVIDSRYVLRQGRPTCADCQCRSGSMSIGSRGGRDAIACEPDEWAAARLPRLQQELRELLRYPPKERKKRLRGLQLELHPDKHTAERRKHAQPLFLLVQAEWEATEAEEKGKKPKRSTSSAGTSAPPPDKEEWHHFREAWHAGNEW